MKTLLHIIPLLLIFLACEKSTMRPKSTNGVNNTSKLKYYFFLTDPLTFLPIDGALVKIVQDHYDIDEKLTANGGTAEFDRTGDRITEVKITKNGYRTLQFEPEYTFDPSPYYNLHLYQAAYLRYRILDEAPVNPNEKLAITYFGQTVPPIYEFELSGVADSTFIKEVSAQNLVITCHTYSGPSLTRSFSLSVKAIARDTTDVLIMY